MIDRYWPELEWDFQKELGLRAMDWIAGKKDWREFYRFRARLGLGSAYFSALANDPELAAIMAERLKDRPTTPQPPSAEGWNPLRDDLADIKDHLTALRGAFTGAKSNELTFTARPKFEIEKIRRRKAVKKLRKAQKLLLPHADIEPIEDDPREGI